MTHVNKFLNIHNFISDLGTLKLDLSMYLYYKVINNNPSNE